MQFLCLIIYLFYYFYGLSKFFLLSILHLSVSNFLLIYYITFIRICVSFFFLLFILLYYYFYYTYSSFFFIIIFCFISIILYLFS